MKPFADVSRLKGASVAATAAAPGGASAGRSEAGFDRQRRRRDREAAEGGAAELARHLEVDFTGRFGHTPSIFVTRPADAAEILPPDHPAQ